jgi:AGZA family xanthine/uracil permease-like MFS transporter
MRPAAQMWEAAWIGLPVMAIILIGFFTNVKLPFGIPVGLAALLVGTAIGWIGGFMSAPDVGQAISDIAIGIPDLRIDLLLHGLSDLAPLLGTAIPLGVYNFTEAMSNVESAAAAGDNYNLRSVLLADGAGAVIGSAFGSPFPPAVYIGHPGWKDAGGRASYSLASGVTIGILCFLGLFGVLDALLPVPAIVPILLYIGLLIGAQAFQAVPRLHAVAVVAALLPNLAQWASGLIDNALNAAGTSAAKVGMEALNGAGVVYDGLQTLGEGAVLVGLILGTMVTFILEKKFLYAAIASAVGAVLSFIGLIHAPEVAWAANPQVALGYIFFGIVCVAYSFLPGAKDPVEIDEADIVAGH